MKSQESVPLTVRILGREYQVACPKDERDHLLASARYLDDRMQAIRKRAAGLGIERIAVMAALNMAREMLHLEKGQKADDTQDVDLDLAQTAELDAQIDDERAAQMQLRIDAELASD